MPSLDPAPASSVRHWATRLLPLLSATGQGRLQRLIDDDGWIGYAAAYTALFPGSLDDPAAKTRADKTFNDFRTNLAAIADEHGIPLGLRVDRRKKAAPAERRLWFVAADDSEARIRGYNQAQIHNLPEHLADQPFSERSEQPQRGYLLLYAKKDRNQAQKLHEALSTELISRDFAWQAMDWHEIDTGARRDDERRAMQSRAQAVVAVVTPAPIAWLKQAAEPFQTRHPVLPLALRPVTADQLRGTLFEGLEVFRDQGRDAWNATTRAKKRDQWIAEAATEIIARLSRPREAQPFDLRPRLRPTDCDPIHYIEQPFDDRAPERGRDRVPDDNTRPDGKTALPYLLDWLRDPEGDCFCAIFGELGMGKTTLAQRLTLELLRLRAGGETALPLPLYLDLRAIHDMPWNWQQGAPALEAMLDYLIRTGHDLADGRRPPDADQIKQLVRGQGGLILFDGLDEVMNRLTPEQCRQLIRALRDVLPAHLWKPGPVAPKDWRRPAGIGRLIMTCRSHFFPHLKAQLSALDGQQREQVSAKDYLWLTLLPFGQAQIEQYFHQVFADDPAKARRVIAMLDEVHDLRELGGLVQGRDTDACLRGLDRLRAAYRPRTSELALAYCLFAHAYGMPGGSLRGFQLQGAELRFQDRRGSPERPLDCTAMDLSGATLDNGRFEDCDLSGSRMTGADLARGLFDRCRLDRVEAGETDLTGACFHDCDADGSRFSGARLYHTQWLAVRPGAAPFDEPSAPLRLFTGDRAIAGVGSAAVASLGHRAGIEQVAWGPDGRWLASAGYDGVVRLWDPESGRLLHTLDGHQGWVHALAVLGHGRWLASAGVDGTVRLWDTAPLDRAPDHRPGCERMHQSLPEGNWVVWQDPDGPNRRWTHYSPGAWRWLGWHAPLPDGRHWMIHPMDAFRAPEPAPEHG